MKVLVAYMSWSGKYERSLQALLEVDGEGQTALCPGCGIDSVIGDRSGFPISREFLERMKGYWF